MTVNFYDVELSADGHAQLVKEKEAVYEASKIGSPEDAVLMMTRLVHLDKKAEEHAYMLSLDCSGGAAGIFFISKGSVNASIVTPREVYIRALLSGAVQIILCHNHPSGDCVPSSSDIKLTKQLKEAGELINITLADHIIIGGGSSGAYLSLREAGLL